MKLDTIILNESSQIPQKSHIVRQLWGFLGFTEYLGYGYQVFSDILMPLYELTKSIVKESLLWESKHEQVFCNLKKFFSSLLS